MRNTLVAALSSCVDDALRSEARRFLVGLSSDELEFIAEFLGAGILEAARILEASCILELESSQNCRRSRAELAERIAAFQRGRVTGVRFHPEDQEHKMILLLEYLCHSGMQEFPATV